VFESTVINRIEQLNEDLYMITEARSVHCYLIVGEEKAVLFDVGYGYEDIFAIASKITDKPINVVASHGDPDHALGAFHCRDLWIHELDWGKLFRYDTPEVRRMMLEYRAKKMPEILNAMDVERFVNSKIRNLRPHFLHNGTTFDLGGGVVLEVLHIPGHSYGGIALLDRETKRLFTGDMVVHYNVWYFGSDDEQAPFSMALASYRKLLSLVKAGTVERLYPAHGPTPVDSSILDELVECFEGELKQNYRNDTPFYSAIGNGWQHFYKHVNLIYSDERLSAFLGVQIER
jgi:glyoxylase-like metal-dependent hydrolase (beta-lactamase superfamily II)